jgi:hypothetical protein
MLGSNATDEDLRRQTVFSFRCAGCGKQHVVGESFEQDYFTNCLRCGEVIHVRRAIVRPLSDGFGESTNPTPSEHAASAGQRNGSAGTFPSDSDLGQIATAELAEVDGPNGTGGGTERDRAAALAQTDEADDEAVDAEEPEWEPTEPEDDGKTARRIVLISGVVLAVLALAGGGAYFVLGRGTVSKTAAKSSKTSTTRKATTPATAPAAVADTAPEKPVVKPTEVLARIAATRLSAELAGSAGAANARYGGKLLEVSGLLDRIENQTATQPAQLRALFACDGPPIFCDLSQSPTEVNLWRRIPAGQPFTVRGIYSKDGELAQCELVPLTPPADARFRGKPAEVTGVIKAIHLPPGRPFPTIELEPDTDSMGELDCVFRLGDEAELKKLQSGLPVIIGGTCGGRSRDMTPGVTSYIVRMDNCQLLDTSAPPSSVARLSGIELLRAYEEDLRPFFLPAPGAEPQVAESLALPRLNKEWAADPKALEKKYLNRVLTVSGKVLQRTPGQSLLVLISGETDHPLQLRCLFHSDDFRELSDDSELRIRGRFTRPVGASVLRLDSCQSADSPGTRDPRRVTADYLPHRPGQQLTYDLAEYPVTGKKEASVKRAVVVQQEGGKSETYFTHLGTLSTKGLFEDDAAGSWIGHKKTTAGRLPGPTFFQRISAGLVELGQTMVKKDGTKDTIWEPVLKVGARAGESWRWSDGQVAHVFQVEKFDQRRGRPSVVIRETVTTIGDAARSWERQHIYVRGVGEVEQRDWLILTSKERVRVGEKRLVE